MLLIRKIVLFAFFNLPRVFSVQWKDAYDLTVGGLGFERDSLQESFDRLPLSAKISVPEDVWNQSIRASGVYVEFVTDSASVYVNYTLDSEYLEFWNMAASGVSAVDILGFDVDMNIFRWMATFKDPQYQNNGLLIEGLTKTRQYRIYFPPYNRVSSFFVGVDDSTDTFEAAPGLKASPLLWYGTSIAQGKAAMIPSSIFTTQIALQMYPSVEILNFGFSSSCHMDLSVADVLNTIDNVSGYVVDCLANMNASMVAERTIPLVKNIRAARGAAMPIFLVENAIYGYEWWDENAAESQELKRANLRSAYDTLVAEGDTAVFYVAGEKLLAPNAGMQVQ